MLPYQVGHLDEDGVQALLRFALGEGRLLNAKPNYENNMVADAGSTIFTLNAAGLQKVVNVYALGMDDQNARRTRSTGKGFQTLADQLDTFEARGKNGELGEITDYDPAFYRVFLMDANGAVPQNPAIDWPWDDLTPPTSRRRPMTRRPKANLDKAQVSAVETVPSGGRTFIYVKAPDGGDQLYSVRHPAAVPRRAEGRGAYWRPFVVIRSAERPSRTRRC